MAGDPMDERLRELVEKFEKNPKPVDQFLREENGPMEIWDDLRRHLQTVSLLGSTGRNLGNLTQQPEA